MPNHIHGIIEITDNNRRIKGGCGCGAQDVVPLRRTPGGINTDYRVNKFQGVVSGSLGSIVRGYKIGVTKDVKILCDNLEYGSIWQRNFYDSIIETDEHLFAAQDYIRNNPSKWKSDLNNPDNQ